LRRHQLGASGNTRKPAKIHLSCEDTTFFGHWTNTFGRPM